MGAISNVTVLADTATVSRVLSADMAPEFKKGVVMFPLITLEELPAKASTNVKGWRRQGSMTTASIVAEANAVGLMTPRQDTAVNATAQKIVRVDGVSIENQRFSNVDLIDYSQSQGRALARGVDDTVLALSTTLSNQVDASGDLTIDHLDEAQLTIFQAEVPMSDMNLNAVIGGRGYRNIKEELRNAGGPVNANERFLSIFDGPPAANGFIGTLPGFDLYAVPAGQQVVGDQVSQTVFHPRWGYAGTIDTGVSVWMDNKGAEGVYTEIVSFLFFSAIVWNQAAAVEVLSKK